MEMASLGSASSEVVYLPENHFWIQIGCQVERAMQGDETTGRFANQTGNRPMLLVVPGETVAEGAEQKMARIIRWTGNQSQADGTAHQRT